MVSCDHQDEVSLQKVFIHMDLEYWSERIQSYWWIRPLKTPPPNHSPPFPLSDDSDEEEGSGGGFGRGVRGNRWRCFLNTFSNNKSHFKFQRKDSIVRRRTFSSSFRFKSKKKELEGQEEELQEVPSSLTTTKGGYSPQYFAPHNHLRSHSRAAAMEPVLVPSSSPASSVGSSNCSKPLDMSSGGADSDIEDDPGKLLNVWLGELDKMKQGLDSPTMNSKGSNLSAGGSSTLLRRQKVPKANHQYRCSLINIEETQDEELDAILGELSVLESQFNEEIKKPSTTPDFKTKNPSIMKKPSTISVVPEEEQQHKVIKKTSPNSSSNNTSGAGSGGSSSSSSSTGTRTESPDNDSAFCDNASVLSSSSSVRTDQSAKSSSGISSSASPTTSNEPDSEEARKEKEAKIKAEKIKLAIEKIKEASIKKLFIKVFTADESAKSILVDEKMTVRHVTRILAEKNHVKLDTKWALVELIPDLYMERVYEDHENLVENCLMWKIDSKNTLWFIERPEKFDVFFRPENYLLGSSSSQSGEQMEEHSRQELLEEYFSSSGVGAPEVEGFIHLKAEGKKSWKKFYFVLRSSGLYYAPKGKKNSKDLVCLSTFDVNQVYYGTGWRKKYLCVETEKELHKWVTGIRIAKNGHQVYENFRGIEEEMVHEDLDILTSKRFSGINSKYQDVALPLKDSPVKEGVTHGGEEDAITPSSENKSFDSALSSSGIASDICSGPENSTSGTTSIPQEQHYTLQRKKKEGDSTPVNTMDRASSSSSGCLSSTSSSAHPRNGFESDFPLGGTIKKRPNVRLQGLSSWEDQKSEDEEEEDEGGANVRVGGGGTLLRSRQSNYMNLHQVQIHRTESEESRLPSPPYSSSFPPPPPSAATDPLSEAFENNLPDLEDEEDFPPPPPPIQHSESLGYLADLPPPPPELLNDDPTLITLKTRKISFDDRVQLIEPSSSTSPSSRPPNRIGSPPKAFLRDLQRFRDEISHLVGTSQRYSRDDSIGQWILQNQIYSDTASVSSPNPRPILITKSALKSSSQHTPQLQQQQILLQEPLYAISSKIPDEMVILREPTPEYDPYSLRSEIIYPQHLQQQPPIQNTAAVR
ncbi:RAPH1 [Lepeophtheirus salmonis]|uniref:RAPH1 n=2 Tax=Lepeophtheirus salmonis TaxID=72036 RepID=A0A7R8CKG5_LEPSM|nr:RAPH1 [Lepeophtheirus salmonis]CAF2849081.1 RAPH1 [Lepeophtheirus salmonis]